MKPPSRGWPRPPPSSPPPPRSVRAHGSSPFTSRPSPSPRPRRGCAAAIPEAERAPSTTKCRSCSICSPPDRPPACPRSYPFDERPRCLHGPLGEDLRRIAGAADLGARWRGELAEYAQRSSADLRRTVAVLERTESLGASLADATRELAASVRQARRAATLEEARTAPIKMLFPLVFLILPAFLLLTVVPVLLTTVRSIR